MADLVESWLTIARQAAADLPGDTELASVRDRSARVALPKALPRLHRTLQWLNIGGAAQVVMNLLFLYDLHLAHAISKQVLSRRDALLESLSAAAELEALCSLACFKYEQPQTCWPRLTSAVELHIEEGSHPLIPPEEVLPNSLQLVGEKRTWIITGSNMAGKSTFLRMAGINLLLAQMGSAATARGMRHCPLRLLTDLRARDNLARHESYYLAEVRQLRRMLEVPADACPVFGLIDEPFRGTNSEEQAAASVAVVQSLIEGPHLFLVATHERRLTELADGATAENYHFQETLEDSGMVFDYRLRPGAAHTRNAILILEREGYPEQIIHRAARFIERPDAIPQDRQPPT
jgi:DNA mismatch repair ATPase MutS